MPQPSATLASLLSQLDLAQPEDILSFKTPNGPLRTGFHLTELKQANFKSIDCCGRLSDWKETHLQILDGEGGPEMTVGKAIRIIHASVNAIEGLENAPLVIEFGHDNLGMMRYEPKNISRSAGTVSIDLAPVTAVCKPALAFNSSGQKSCG